MLGMERRFTPGTLSVGNEGRSIGGYAAVFNKLSRNLGGFVEELSPSVFNRSQADGWGDGVVCRYNHDDNGLLGTTNAGTLRLTVDRSGLLYDVDPPKSRSDILELVERGDVSKSSFAFRVVEDDWTLTDQNYPKRMLQSVELVDVAPVVTPAYVDTSAGLRSLALKFDAPLEEVRAMAEENDLRRFFSRSDRPSEPRGGNAPGDGSKPYGDVDYADPGYQADKKKRYPLDNHDHVVAAWDYINVARNAGKYSAEQVASIKGRIKSAAKKFGISISDDERCLTEAFNEERGSVTRHTVHPNGTVVIETILGGGETPPDGHQEEPATSGAHSASAHAEGGADGKVVEGEGNGAEQHLVHGRSDDVEDEEERAIGALNNESDDVDQPGAEGDDAQTDPDFAQGNAPAKKKGGKPSDDATEGSKQIPNDERVESDPAGGTASVKKVSARAALLEVMARRYPGA